MDDMSGPSAQPAAPLPANVDAVPFGTTSRIKLEPESVCGEARQRRGVYCLLFTVSFDDNGHSARLRPRG